MKETFLTLSFIISLACFGQVEKSCQDEILYEKGMAIKEIVYNDSLYFSHSSKEKKAEAKRTAEMASKKALIYFDQLIAEFPKSQFLILALYEKGILENNLGNDKIAKDYFIKVVNFEILGKEYYKAKSLIILASMAIQEKDFKQAMIYLNERKKKGFASFCGNDIALSEMQMKNMFDVCTTALKTKN